MILACSNCDKDLVEVINRGGTFDKQIMAKCPYCFDQSYYQPIDNKYSIFPLNELELLDVEGDTDEENCKVIVYLAETA